MIRKNLMDMKKISLFILLFFMFAFLLLLVGCEKNTEDTPEPISSDWVQYGIDKDENVWTYNRNLNIKKEGDDYRVSAWAKRILSEKGREKIIQQMKSQGKSIAGYEKLSEDKILNEVDCKNKRYKILSVISYDKDGKVLFSEDSKESNWTYVAPNSNGSIFFKKVCPEK